MAITNGYATLSELKQRLKEEASYTASTISFAQSSKKISDSAYGLRAFETNDVIQVSGSTGNNGYYNIATGNNAGEIVTTENLTDESAGSTVTIQKVIDKTNDAILEAAVESASRHIDNYCNQFFYSSTGLTMYYTPEDPMILFTDPITTVTSIKTDDDGDRTYDDTWATGDYDLMPWNASNFSRPYDYIEVNPDGDYTFTVYPKSVQIIGDFGWSSIPAAIKQACLILSARFLKRESAPLGVAGTAGAGELRQIMEEDPDVARLLQPYVRII